MSRSAVAVAALIAAAAICVLIAPAPADAVVARVPAAVRKLRARVHRVETNARTAVRDRVRDRSKISAQVTVGDSDRVMNVATSWVTTSHGEVKATKINNAFFQHFADSVAFRTATVAADAGVYAGIMSYADWLDAVEVWKPQVVSNYRVMKLHKAYTNWNADIDPYPSGWELRIRFKPGFAVNVKSFSVGDVLSAAVSCGFKARTYDAARFIPACGRALVAGGAPLANLQYAFAAVDLRGGAPGAPALTAAVTLELNEPVAIVMEAVIANAVSATDTVRIPRSVAAAWNTAFIAALNAARTASNVLADAIVDGAPGTGNAVLRHNNVIRAYGDNGLNVAQAYLVEYFTAASIAASFPAGVGAALGLHAPGIAMNQQHPNFAWLYINYLDPNWYPNPAGAPPGLVNPGGPQPRITAPDAVYTGQLAAAIGNAAAQTPQGLMAHLTGPPNNNAGYDDASPARALHRALHEARGTTPNHFGYGYVQVTVRMTKRVVDNNAGNPNAVAKVVGWFCAAANTPNSEAVGDHTEAKCMEALRQFVISLEAVAANNGFGSTTKVSAMSSRWQIDYVPDFDMGPRCEWMFQWLGVIIPAGHFREAPYTTAVRDLVDDPANNNHVDPLRTVLLTATNWIAAQKHANVYTQNPLAVDIIAWTPPAIAWTFTTGAWVDPANENLVVPPVLAVGTHQQKRTNADDRRRKQKIAHILGALNRQTQLNLRALAQMLAGIRLEDARQTARANARAVNLVRQGQGLPALPLPGGVENGVILSAVPTLADEQRVTDPATHHAGRYGDGNALHAAGAVHPWPWFPSL